MVMRSQLSRWWQGFPILKKDRDQVLRIASGRRPRPFLPLTGLPPRPRQQTAAGPGTSPRCLGPAPAARRKEAEGSGEPAGQGGRQPPSGRHAGLRTRRTDVQDVVCSECASRGRKPRAQTSGGARRGAGPRSVYLLPGHPGLAPGRWRVRPAHTPSAEPSPRS